MDKKNKGQLYIAITLIAMGVIVLVSSIHEIIKLLK